MPYRTREVISVRGTFVTVHLTLIDDVNHDHAVEASTAYEVNMLDETEQVARTRAEAIKKLEHLIAATKK